MQGSMKLLAGFLLANYASSLSVYFYEGLSCTLSGASYFAFDVLSYNRCYYLPINIPSAASIYSPTVSNLESLTAFSNGLNANCQYSRCSIVGRSSTTCCTGPYVDIRG